MSLPYDWLKDPLLSLALCWRIARQDGVILAFTSHDQDLLIDATRYQASVGLESSALMANVDVQTTPYALGGGVSLQGLSQQDLEAGRYDGALVHVFVCDWQAPQARRLPLAHGRFGALKRDGPRFEVQVEGATRALDNSVFGLTTPTCRAELGDALCRVNLRKHRQLASVARVISAQQFVLASDNLENGFASQGRLRWLSGANTGLDQDVLEQTLEAAGGAIVTLFEPPPAGVARPGDRLLLYAGCDKRFITCQTRFDNALNFRGEPFVPGLDAMVRYGTG
jgi:uncharacterized phage protein (TIGR02218 family)